MDDKALTVFESNNITITAEERETFVRSISSQNPTEPELKLYFYDCARRGIHPLDKLLYFTKRKGKYTPITSIDYMRMRAESSGAYAGSDDAAFDDGDDRYPYSATITVYKMVGNTRCPFTATARWEEYSPDLSQDFAFMWKKMPKTMLAKCAEALALRKAFPGVLHGLYIKEEMDQAGVVDGEVVATKSIPTGSDDLDREAVSSIKRMTVPKFATPVATSLTPTAEPKHAVSASASEPFPVIEPTDTGDFIHMITIWNGRQQKPANQKIPMEAVEWFKHNFIGRGKAFESSFELFGNPKQEKKDGSPNLGHLGKYFNGKRQLSDLTWKEYNALVKYAYAQIGDPLGKIDPEYYAGKIEEAVGGDADKALAEAGSITAEAAETDAVAIVELWGNVAKDVETAPVLQAVFGVDNVSVLDDDKRRQVWLLLKAVGQGVVAATVEDMTENLKLG